MLQCVTTNKNINVPEPLFAPHPCFHCSSLRPISPLTLPVFPKYVSLYHMRHHRIGLSEAGNDFFFLFFFALISALRGIREVLVIRPFITLPARHSAVWVNAISPDSHNYPKIERGREISPEKRQRGSGRVEENTPKEREEGTLACLRTRVVCLDGVGVCVWSSHVSSRKRNAGGINLHHISHAVESYSSIMNITQRLYTHQSHFLSQSSTLFLISFPRVLIFWPLQGLGLLPAGRVHTPWMSWDDHRKDIKR